MATYYCNASTGVDNYPTVVGSEAAPWKTLPYALLSTNFTGGDTLFLRDAAAFALTSTLTIPTSLSGSSGAYTIIKAYPTETPTITISGSLNAGIALATGTHYVEFNTLIVQNAGALYAFKNGGTNATPNTFLRYIDIDISGDGGGCILTDTSNNCYYSGITGHDFGDNGGGEGHGIYMSGNSSNNIMEDSEFSGMQANKYGIHVYSGSNSPSNNVFRRVKVHTSEGGNGVLFGGNGSNNVIESFSVYNIDGSGVALYTGSGHKAYNGSIYNCGSNGIYCRVNVTGSPEIRNVISLGNGTNLTMSSTSGITSNNISSGTAATYFVDAPNGDLSLNDNATTQANAIGQGIAIEGLSYDIDGNLFDDPPTIGAYEFNTLVPPTPPTNVHGAAYTVTTQPWTALSGVSVVQGTDEVVEVTLASTGKAALNVDTTNVIVDLAP